MVRSALIAILCFALLPAAAFAQAPSTLYTGGSVGVERPRVRDLGDTDIGLRVRPDGTVAIRAVTYAQCARGRRAEVARRGTARLNPDGTFRGVLRRATQFETRGFRARMEVSGRIEGATATGTTETFGRGGTSRLRNCRGTSPWRAFTAPTVGPAPAPVPAGAVLLGMTSKTAAGPFGMHLRVSPDGTRVAKIIANYRTGCRRLSGLEETNYSPPARIAADGTFTANERFTTRFTDAVDRVTVRLSGRFVAGGAAGTFRARVVSRSRRTGRVGDRCDSGLIRWSAAVR